MNQELCWRAFCWFENIRWSPGFQGAVWHWHYKNSKAQIIHNRDRDKVMMELSA
jgi:hypothetical protein